jgi:HAD superfamily hydrolase (TIGR01459 family)
MLYTEKPKIMEHKQLSSPYPIPVAPGLLDVSPSYPAILLDAYGVFWAGNRVGLFPGCKEVMEQLVASGKIVGILSNSTQLAVKEKEKFKKQGLIEGQHFHFFLSSGEVAREMFLNQTLPFETPRKRFWLLGEIHPSYSSHQEIFRDTPYQETKNLSEADFIYIAIPHIQGEDQTDPQVFAERIEQLRPFNLPMVCTNPDRFAHEGNPPRPVVRQGSIAAMYEKIGGTVYYIGKPSALVYAAAMEHFTRYKTLLPSEVLMVGDTPETDIRGARQFGMGSALLLQTGILAERITHQGLEATIGQLDPRDYPTFFIERMAK